MSFKIIENDMIVKNNITFEPHITFVSASNDCEDLVGHNLASSGISGSIPVTNMTHKYYKDELKGTRVYDIDNATYKSTVQEESLNSIDVLNEARNGNVFEQELNAKGIFFNTNFLVKIEAANIGKDAFFEPEIFIVPLILFFPFISNLCI